MRITENQKQNINFKTYTCRINVCGIEREIKYDNVIWLSSNKRWIFYINDCGHFQIEKLGGWIGDLPLLYDDDSVVYDNSYNIPKYIKDKVQKTLISLRQYE